MHHGKPRIEMTIKNKRYNITGFSSEAEAGAIANQIRAMVDDLLAS